MSIQNECEPIASEQSRPADQDAKAPASSPFPAGDVKPSRRQFLAGAAGAGLAAPLLANADPLPVGGANATVPHQGDRGTMTVTLNVNGAAHTMVLEPRVTLLDALRERLDLTGTKKGCDHGQCGACTVHIDGRRVNSCLTLAIMHQDAKITTIEGLADGENLHPIQSAFIAHDGFQCGYCTPGQIMSGAALLQEGHAKTPLEIREQMSGNICRCGAYPNIVDAIQSVMEGKNNGPV